MRAQQPAAMLVDKKLAEKLEQVVLMEDVAIRRQVRQVHDKPCLMELDDGAPTILVLDAHHLAKHTHR
jgi:hypothetical protein